MSPPVSLVGLHVVVDIATSVLRGHSSGLNPLGDVDNILLVLFFRVCCRDVGVCDAVSET